ncbi:MAG: hypothetical protein OEW42_09245 [Acidimicrobiia bacterium]|nr:hypothetical protein [Acidimicrobiia bacterium]MDH5236033.1 hypothetical protein [Acidimicrobiia bacterium]
MATFQILLQNGSTEIIDGVDGYEPEGPMTTFFRSGSSRAVIDSWSERVASVRTVDIAVVRRLAADPESVVLTV